MRATAGLSAACLLILTACGGNDTERDAGAAPALPSTDAAVEPSSEAPPSGPPRSDRGNIVKALGEEGGMCGPAATECTREALVLTFTIDSITPGIECNSGFASPPDNGHYIGIALRVATSPDYPADQYFTTFTAELFSVIGPDGLTIDNVQGQAASCLGPNAFTYDPLGPGQKYAGTVVIDSPVKSGVLVYKEPGAATGWEWQF